MFNKEEYLLLCLNQKCSEVQNYVSKILRFGIKTSNSTNYNSEELVVKINSLVSVLELLDEFENLTGIFQDENILIKKKNIEFDMECSKKLGTLES